MCNHTFIFLFAVISILSVLLLFFIFFSLFSNCFPTNSALFYNFCNVRSYFYLFFQFMYRRRRYRYRRLCFVSLETATYKWLARWWQVSKCISCMYYHHMPVTLHLLQSRETACFISHHMDFSASSVHCIRLLRVYKGFNVCLYCNHFKDYTCSHTINSKLNGNGWAHMYYVSMCIAAQMTMVQLQTMNQPQETPPSH